MKNQPLVSIITPSYNQAEYLEKTITSVLGQTYPNIEYIIIDGGSEDGSKEIIEKYQKKIKYWVSEPDQGQTDAINKGFAKANGEILAWLNSDDTYEPHAVAEAVTYLLEHPEIGLVYGDTDFIDAQDRKIGKFPSAQTDLRRLKRGYVHVAQQASFWRAELWKQVGPLDPSFYFAMDYDLWVRLASVTEIKYLPKQWANFRLHGHAKTIANDDRCWPEMIRVHQREGGAFFSVIMAKFYLRKLLAPFINWRRKRRLVEPIQE
ncbi:MAG: glycosyltransferase [Chloroflexi bacterium]|jgi:glycosyltransferase involved in cell wall biosynthesis|nr:glycosyltransferase [Chloroflexota bacterium]MBT3670039.1 glycosyltransferase [Chloroflexota bacterium]MBT4003526.1 glycosyltransferase [Chloroflexota bacterium]MBT4306759.1 glycosyltransferase [Chloroflexota bacterium]MBT4532925.1 glycosyltransferase [Chloroflexota bacterium]